VPRLALSRPPEEPLEVACAEQLPEAAFIERLGKGTKANTIALHDSKDAGPIFAARQGRDDPGVVCGWICPFNAQQDDSAGCWKSGAKGQLTKVRVARDHHSLIGLRV